MRREPLRAFLLLTPALLVLGGLFLGSFAPALLQSLGHFPAVGMTGYTLGYYRELFGDPEFLGSLLFSLRISCISSALAVVLGTFLGFLLFSKRKKEGVQRFLALLPIAVPHTVAALLVLQLLSRTGMLGRFLFSLGILASPAEMGSFVFDPSGVGVIVAYLWKGLPFAAVVVAVVLRTLDPRLCEAALVLGASRIQVFWHVLLPLLFPTLSSTFVLLFGFSFGAFEVPFLLGPTFPQALPVAAYRAYLNPDMASRPYAMVYVVVITAMVLGLVFLYGFLARRGERFS